MTKLFMKAVSGVVLVGSLLVLTGCPGDKNATVPQKVQLQKLSKTWTMVTSSGALYNGTDDRTAAFSGFKLTISGTFDKNNEDGPYNYSVAGSMQDPSPWPASGSWTFNSVDQGSDSGTLTRDDGVPMQYSIQSDGKLVLIFDCSSCNYPGARVSTVNGNWKFTFQ